MRKKNTLNRFGDKFSGKNFGKSLIFCMVFFGLICSSNIVSASMSEETCREYCTDKGLVFNAWLEQMPEEDCEENGGVPEEGWEGNNWVKKCTYTNIHPPGTYDYICACKKPPVPALTPFGLVALIVILTILGGWLIKRK